VTTLTGLAIPYTPLARVLGFVPPPPSFIAFVAVATAVYLGTVELAKRRIATGIMG